MHLHPRSTATVQLPPPQFTLITHVQATSVTSLPHVQVLGPSLLLHPLLEDSKDESIDVLNPPPQ
jgi:hypothetical protein